LQFNLRRVTFTHLDFMSVYMHSLCLLYMTVSRNKYNWPENLNYFSEQSQIVHLSGH